MRKKKRKETNSVLDGSKNTEIQFSIDSNFFDFFTERKRRSEMRSKLQKNINILKGDVKDRNNLFVSYIEVTL
jgi:hypothetical protein